MESIDTKTKFKRVLKAGFFNFWRSGYVSLSSVYVMIVTLFVIGGVLFLSAILNQALNDIRDKVDINVYFLTTAPEEDILALKTKIESISEVSSVEYINREQSLENFRREHENDQITLQALEELGDNPLGAVLNIKAREPSQYESIANFLNEENILSSEGSKIIDSINYFRNREAIDKLTLLIDSTQRLGFLISLALVLVSIVITFNTVRLAIFISKEEISVMQLVGASKNYVRGPFVITGIIVGLVSGIITLLLFLPITYSIGNMTYNFAGVNIFTYYISNFLQIVFIILGSGILVGAISSLLAVRKYLKL